MELRSPFLGLGPEVTLPHVSANPLVSKILHNSHVEQLTTRCAKQFKFQNVDNFRRTFSDTYTPMDFGSAAHKGAEIAIDSAITGQVPNFGKISDDVFKKYIENKLGPDDRSAKIYQEMQLGIMAAYEWVIRETNVTNLHSEKPWYIPEIGPLLPNVRDNIGWGMSGTMDLVEIDETAKAFRIFDYKFRAKNREADNEKSPQAPQYKLAMNYYGYKGEFYFLEILHTGRLTVQKIDITPYDEEFHLQRLEDTFFMLGEMIFPMNTGGWWCGPKYCSAWSVCRGKGK